jgi:urea carboxylase
VFDTVLIANRGAIACRVMRTLRKMGLRSVAVYSEADADAAHVALADAAVCIGPAPAAQSYLDVPRILQAARDTGAGAIHPGYGFLSENAAFAEACEAAGLAFIGPTPQQMRAFGLKHTARALAQSHGVPLLPGSGLLADAADAAAQAARIGYPVMLKSTGGGGGIGMRLVRAPAELPAAYEAVERLARANFKDAGLFLEKFVEQARHIEVQVFGNGRGHVVALGERDCSAQRRHQKVIEETPAPGLSDETRAALTEAALRLARAVDYRSAGTVEFVLDADTGAFYFLEVNTRLQVEHGVTEQVTGVDLVEWMVALALGGDREPLLQVPPPTGVSKATPPSGTSKMTPPGGVSIQARLYAEDPSRGFQPCAGLLTEARFPADARVETWVAAGTEVPPHYDPMLAKLIVTAPDRPAAVAALRAALAATRLAGIETNLRYLRAVAASPVFQQGRVVTRTLAELAWAPHAVEVLEPGVQTSVQDHPGRLGHWDVGVPPSGPMDDLAFRLANRLVGNGPQAAGLECTLTGPSLRFHRDTVVAVCGAPMAALLDGQPLPLWQAHAVPAGSVLKLGAVDGAGARAYVALRGGLDVPAYLGSRATFTLGGFGGHAGRVLRAGDLLHVGSDSAVDAAATADAAATPATAPGLPVLPAEAIPAYGHHWDIAVLYGPHGAPDFFTDADIRGFFATAWQVHYNSSRTGVRLVGPKPQWARADGGEAGLHPSNIHDNAYAIGAIDFTGDMPVVLGPDGPSLGGFVCPAVVVAAERWKLGQLRPGDTLRFHAVDADEAAALQARQEHWVRELALPRAEGRETARKPVTPSSSPVLLRREAHGDRPELTLRQAGDRYLLVELGPLQLDIALRLRVHGLMSALAALALPGIVDLTPGIRSLQLHFDPARLPRRRLVDAVLQADDTLGDTDSLVVPSRTVHLPLAWDDSATRAAIGKYTQSVRPDAPWCPSNIEFIRRINGLGSVDDVQCIVLDASYLVLGLGDVYLGAPVATPLDPRHRLVTTKYNPARTWTPENAVGIGGAYLCIYGMEGPGGYQFVGRTLQMWNRWRDASSGARDFEPGRPWLLRFFDRLRFHLVSEDELMRIRRDFPQGRYPLRTEPGEFSVREYRRFLQQHATGIAGFKQRQQAAFDAERERWRAAGQADYVGDDGTPAAPAETEALPPGVRAVTTPVPGSVWKLLAAEGDDVAEGAPLLLVEAMKMEFTVAAPCAGRVQRLACREGTAVSAGQEVAWLKAE